MGSTGGPHLGYNRNVYPYGLPPNFTPPTMHENVDHAIPITFEGQLPQPIGGTREKPQERAQVDVDSYPPFTVEGLTFHAMPQPNTAEASQPCSIQPLHFFVEGPPLVAEGKGKLDLIEERLRAVKGSGGYLFANMTDLYLVSDVVILPNSRYRILTGTRGPLAPKII